MGSQKWSQNLDKKSHDLLNRVLPDVGLTLRLAFANPQLSHPENYDHGVGLPHLDPTHNDHGH